MGCDININPKWTCHKPCVFVLMLDNFWKWLQKQKILLKWTQFLGLKTRQCWNLVHTHWSQWNRFCPNMLLCQVKSIQEIIVVGSCNTYLTLIVIWTECSTRGLVLGRMIFIYHWKIQWRIFLDQKVLWKSWGQDLSNLLIDNVWASWSHLARAIWLITNANLL